MKTNGLVLMLVSFVSVFSGCSSDAPVDLGDDKTASNAQGLAAYEGAWDGYAEAYKFPSGSDRVRITLDVEGHGTLEVGDAPAIPPFSDPDVGYPTTDAFEPYTDAFIDHSNPHEGHGYAVDAILESGRLRLGFWGTDLQRPWCEAQTSYVDASASPLAYTCAAAGSSWGTNGDNTCVGGDELPVDCGFLSTCLYACECDVNGCTSQRFPTSKLELDAALENDGTTLVGTFALRDGRVTIRLQRN